MIKGEMGRRVAVCLEHRLVDKIDKKGVKCHFSVFKSNYGF